MGEQSKEEKPEEKREEDDKKDEQKEEKKEDEDLNIALKVDMHCKACARKVKKTLKGVPGVEDVEVDSKSQQVIVKGKSVDPVKVFEIVKKKSGRKTELVSPLRKTEEDQENKEEKQEEKEEEKPSVVTVVLKLHMHCGGCARKVKRVIMKMNGVQSAEPDLEDSKVTVTGILDPLKLVEHVYKKTGKHAELVHEEKEEEKKDDNGDNGGKEEENKEKEENKEEESKGETEGGTGDNEGEVNKNEIGALKYIIEYAPPPQIFSDENPNACSIM